MAETKYTSTAVKNFLASSQDTIRDAECHVYELVKYKLLGDLLKTLKEIEKYLQIVEQKAEGMNELGCSANFGTQYPDIRDIDLPDIRKFLYAAFPLIQEKDRRFADIDEAEYASARGLSAIVPEEEVEF